MTSNTDVAFCRSLLVQVAGEVKAIRPSINVWRGRDSWILQTGRQDWEFNGPDDFHWHGNATNGYDARYQGWSAWVEFQRHESGKSQAATEDGKMTAELVTHYQSHEGDQRAACGRDVLGLGLKASTDPRQCSCRLCSEHEDVQFARAQKQENQNGEKSEAAQRL